MKKFFVFFLTISLFFGIGFPLLAQENPGRFVMEEPQNQPKITLSENRILIENLPKDDILEVFNIMGVKIYSQRVKAGTNEYTHTLPKGYYILRVGNLTKKVAVK